jgi:hypothetical protein
MMFILMLVDHFFHVDLGSMEAPSLKRITYLSTAVCQFDHAQLQELAMHAAKNNAKHQITGVMYYKGGEFLQVIEGPSEAIDDLWSRLRQDDRHTWLEALWIEDNVQRSFTGWNMGLCDLNDAQPPPRSEFTAIANFLKLCPDLEGLAIVDALLKQFAAAQSVWEHEAAA